MTKNELNKEFNEEWNEQNHTKYLVMRIFKIIEWIPWLICLYLIYATDIKENLLLLVICFTFAIALLAINFVLAKDKGSEWRKYLEKNKSKLN